MILGIKAVLNFPEGEHANNFHMYYGTQEIQQGEHHTTNLDLYKV